MFHNSILLDAMFNLISHSKILLIDCNVRFIDRITNWKVLKLKYCIISLCWWTESYKLKFHWVYWNWIFEQCSKVNFHIVIGNIFVKNLLVYFKFIKLYSYIGCLLEIDLKHLNGINTISITISNFMQ